MEHIALKQIELEFPGELREALFTSVAHPLGVHASSKSEEHYTPPEILAYIIELLGEIDLDPCSNSTTKPVVPASTHYTKAENGLIRSWYGRVYCNPPYGRSIGLWIDRAIYHYVEGLCEQIVLLVPARTDTRWFRQLAPYPKCFLQGRLKFSGAKSGAPFPSAVVYMGPRLERFQKVFSPLGMIHGPLEVRT